MSNISIKGEEHVDWSIMGPIYEDQCKALKQKINELENFIFNLSKEFGSHQTETIKLD